MPSSSTSSIDIDPLLSEEENSQVPTDSDVFGVIDLQNLENVNSTLNIKNELKSTTLSSSKEFELSSSPPSSTSSSTLNSNISADTEIFIAGIAKDVVEQDLQQLCDGKFGGNSVKQIRLMKDKITGENKGYAFICFESKSICNQAIQQLNNVLLKGKNLKVKGSENKRKIFIGNLPKEMPKDELLAALNGVEEGVTAIDLLMDPDIPTKNRGFAFIEYSDHYLAEKARKHFSLPSFSIGNHTTITVNWADPVVEPSADEMKQVKVLYIRNLPECRDEQEIKELFSKHGVVEKVIVPSNISGSTQRRDFGFVHFIDRETAENVLDIHANDPITYHSRQLLITFAKPVDKKQREDLRQKKFTRNVNRNLFKQQQQQQFNHQYQFNNPYQQPMMPTAATPIQSMIPASYPYAQQQQPQYLATPYVNYNPSSQGIPTSYQPQQPMIPTNVFQFPHYSSNGTPSPSSYPTYDQQTATQQQHYYYNNMAPPKQQTMAVNSKRYRPY
ncbi:hypothetical protein CYY_002382 [Polysphondylium violaceum]|uniref:RRM domain-containing protein n=1 Tax=Polysphondylium violaceum TaxID=133409 RepID=A0A8J4PYJ2_9MYCE|nr:hypothetical protein CYY_002382 [Polysphondylium violaceum]